MAEAASGAELAVANAIERIGLKLAAKIRSNKTEAVVFVKKVPRLLSIISNTGRINPNISIKYLGLYVDSKWSFANHFKQLTRKINAVTSSLCRLISNMRDPIRLDFVFHSTGHQSG